MKRVFMAWLRALPLLWTYIMFHIFIMAYMHPSFKAIVNINAIGEAHIELLILTALMPFVTYVTLKDVWRIWHVRDKDT